MLDPARPAELDRSLLDLALLTGRNFFHRSAAEFFAFSIASTRRARRDFARRAPPDRGAYGTGSAWAARFGTSTTTRRLQPGSPRPMAALGTCVTGCARPSVPTTAASSIRAARFFPRREPQGATATCGSRPACGDSFLADVRAGGVSYMLQAQLLAAPTDAAEIDRALDCTRPWSQGEAPWRDLARLEFDEVVPAEALADLEINPVNAPSDLGVIAARTERDSASIAHVRTIVYEASAAARLGRPLSPGPACAAGRTANSCSARSPPRSRSSALAPPVSHLPAHSRSRATRSPCSRRTRRSAGCARPEVFDGVACDLGGHMIYPATYPTIVELAREFGQTLVSDFPDCMVSLETGGEVPLVATAGTRAAKVRIAQLLLRSGALEPGLQSIDRTLAMPIADWLARENLGAIWDWMGPLFVGPGTAISKTRCPRLTSRSCLRTRSTRRDATTCATASRPYGSEWRPISAMCERVARSRHPSATRPA